ncbi:ulp1 protease family protein [Colletotrichum karsti]|uniref:Ulp1 protease family protein n=1 Tax=Colletotrichum karsti TaxID=1095194 RepID=A0A9P6I258_9PEZI|nr:ulp1 protease family protein [Colletotrichum karsti]KAF9870535.1 ulp1 protease family protein [Colletotrichum karsti]
MKRGTEQDRSRPRRNGFLRKPGDFLDRCNSRAETLRLPNLIPTTFDYRWHTDPTSPGLLYNPGLDPRDPLAGLVLPRQLGPYVGRRYGQGKADHKPVELSNRSIATPATASILTSQTRSVFSAPKHRGPPELSTAAAAVALGFPRPSQNELLKRATTAKLNLRGEKVGRNYEIPFSEDEFSDSAAKKPLPGSENSKLTIFSPGKRRKLFNPGIDNKTGRKSKCSRRDDEVLDIVPETPEVLPRSERNKLTVVSPAKRRKLFSPAVKEKSKDGAPSVQPFPEQNTLVLQPKQTATIQITDTKGTRNFNLGGPGYRRVVLQSSDNWGHPLPSSPFAERTSASLKRRAEDTEFDLLAANATDQGSGGQHSTNLQVVCARDLEEQGRGATGRTAWLSNIMTSVRGTVAKVYSIAGYVERHSRDEHSGNITTKRIKVEPDVDSASVTGIHDEHRTHGQQSHKTNLVWIDESTRIANWHQVAALAQALKDIDARIQKGRVVERSGSPCSRLVDECRSRRLHTLSAHVKSFQQTAHIIEHIYSHTFLSRLKEMSKVPRLQMDYATNPDEYLAISAAKLFLDELPKECVSSLAEAGVTLRVINGVSADLDAIVNQRPMPGLVQRAGFVGKVMKLIRGRESFGFESSNTTMPGSFPTETNNEPVYERSADLFVKSEAELGPGPDPEPELGRLEKKPSPACMPVTQTETYTYVLHHLAEMETKGKAPQKTPADKVSEEAFAKNVSNPILKRDRSSPALKRLQKSRGLKRVHFSPSAKQSSPSPAKSPGFFSRIFRRHETTLSSPLRLFEDESSLGDSQTDRSPDVHEFEKTGQDFDTEPETDITSQDSDSEVTMARCRSRLVQRLNESMGLSNGNENPTTRSRSPSPPTLAGLRISDDKEGELDDLSAAFQLIFDVNEAQRRAEEDRKAKEAEEKRLRLTGGLRVPKRRLVTSLSSTWSQRVRETIRANPNQVLTVTAESVDLRRHDFLKVVPETEWLNDEIVNGSLLWVDRYVNEAAGAPEMKSTKRVCLFMNSFFYKRLEDNGVQGTERALRRFGVSKTNFLDLETILMPICRNNHWTLLVVRPQKRTVSHMDSLNPRGTPSHTKRALDWIKAVLGDDFKADEWRTVRHEAPGQDNGYDCGVFTITNGICLALGINAIDAYSNDELPLQRLRIAAMLLNKGFKGDFDLSDL